MRDDTQSKPQPEPIVTGDSTVCSQVSLLRATVIAEPPDPTTTLFRHWYVPTAHRSIQPGCLRAAYQQELKLRGKSDYTITCSLRLKMFSDFIGRDTPVAALTRQVTDWLMKLKFGTKVRFQHPNHGASCHLPQEFFSWLGAMASS